MHMADALLSPAVGTTFWVGTFATIAYVSRKLKQQIDDKLVPLMGVLGAFIFAAQMINFTIPGTGSSGHLAGGMILAIILGPYAAFLVTASVITVQALFFADGGLMALGCNIWNMGFYACFLGYPFIYKPLLGGSQRPPRILAAALLSAIAVLQLGALSVVLQTWLSGKSELPFLTFLLLMQPIHLAIGIVEGFVTAGVINYVRSARPELLDSLVAASSKGAAYSLKKVLATFLALAILMGGALSWFASAYPDGLEWAITKTYGKSDLPEQSSGLAQVLDKIQGETAIFPDYRFQQKRNGMKELPAAARPESPPAISVPGVIGAFLVLAIILLIGVGIRFFRR